MALSKLSGDEQRILFVQLCNVLDPGLAVALSSVSNELRTATQALLWGCGAARSCARRRRSAVATQASPRPTWRRWARWAWCCLRLRGCSSSNAQAQPATTACSGW
eukprot:scaffold31252_cov63-Phaeocystis_antarctica.AAC.14